MSYAQYQARLEEQRKEQEKNKTIFKDPPLKEETKKELPDNVLYEDDDGGEGVKVWIEDGYLQFECWCEGGYAGGGCEIPIEDVLDKIQSRVVSTD